MLGGRGPSGWRITSAFVYDKLCDLGTLFYFIFGNLLISQFSNEENRNFYQLLQWFYFIFKSIQQELPSLCKDNYSSACFKCKIPINPVLCKIT